ncbi:MAG: YidC/Oxa1 family insertase periplasmic-domain containing protein [Phycisphaerales bacterium]
MPARLTTALRILLPLALLLGVIAVPGALGQDTGSDAAPPPIDQPVLEPAPVATDVDADAAPAPDAAEPAAGPVLAARVFPPQAFDPIGSLNPDDRHMSELRFTPFGAGIESLQLTHDFETVDQTDHVELQRTETRADGVQAVPFALLAVEINATRVDLVGVGANGQLWQQIAPGRFQAIIDDADGNPVARVERAFTIAPERFDITLNQHLVNLSNHDLTVKWIQTGPINLPKDESSYGGDKRRVRFGTISQAQIDLAKSQGLIDATVSADNDLHRHSWAVAKKVNGRYETRRTIWPNEKSAEKQLALSWFALTDRYFCVAEHPIIDPATATKPADKVFTAVERLDRLVLNPDVANSADATVVLETTSPPQTVAPGGTTDASIGLYAGPMSRPIVAANPMLAALGLDRLVVYNFGGPCSFCTFPWMTHVLLAVLRFNHMLTGDWALSIILLVVFVRTALHPITRWSQIRMQRFGAQMQAMGPKQAKLKEKYADDPKRLQQETAKLWKEEGINPAGMLGCLPMMLQSPVWIALYATLFFAAELRHQPGFYGVFQTISGGAWPFLADLSAPDSAIPLPSFLHFSFPIWGSVHAINFLPILMGVVYFIQQKYLVPPTAATMTPEQEQQQKMMKIMMVVMFPVFMYAAPSGLAIYFVTNSTLGILEARWIRAHAKKHGLLDVEKIKAKRNPTGGGFLARLQAAAERRQKMENEARNQGAGFGTGRSRQGIARSAPDKKIIDRKYKKRKDG